MTRARKIKTKNIEKLHELIDIASLPKHNNTASYDEKKLEFLPKRLPDEALKIKEKVTSSGLKPTESESLKPRVVVHNLEDIQKKEEKVIQIELGPKTIKKQKEHAIVGFTTPEQNLFTEESLHEVEKVPFLEEESREVKQTDVSKKSEIKKEFIPVVFVQKHEEKNLPEWELVTKEITEKETVDVKKGKSIETFLPEFERVDEKQSPLPLRSPKKEKKIHSLEPVEFELVTEEKQQVERSEVRKKKKDELLHKKLEEKQKRQQAKEKKRESKRRAKEHDEKLQLEQITIQKKQREDQKRKLTAKKKAAAKEKDKDQEKQRLLKEHEEKLRLERSEVRTRKKKTKKKEKPKRRKLKKEKKAAVTTSAVQKKPAPVKTRRVGEARTKQRKIRKKP